MPLQSFFFWTTSLFALSFFGQCTSLQGHSNGTGAQDCCGQGGHGLKHLKLFATILRFPRQWHEITTNKLPPVGCVVVLVPGVVVIAVSVAAATNHPKYRWQNATTLLLCLHLLDFKHGEMVSLCAIAKLRACTVAWLHNYAIAWWWDGILWYRWR